jgi:hypothetical protein
MGLAIESKKGQKTVHQEIKMLKYIEKCWNVKIKITDKKKPIEHDGIIIKNNKIIGIFESKNRQFTLYKLEKFGSWLITYEKLEKCRLIAKKMKVPLYGFLGIELSNLIMYWKICDGEGNYLFNFEHYYSYTQDTCEGGEAYRDNAFLPIKYGILIQPNQKI